MKNRIIGIVAAFIVIIVFSAAQYESVLQQLTEDRVVLKEIKNQNSSQNSKKDKSADDGLTAQEIEKIKQENQGETDKSETDSVTEEEGIKKSSLTAKAAALVDASNGRVLYEKNGYEELPMASTTKIMTCIIALENANLDDVVTISKYAASMPDVQLNAVAGEKFYLRDLLYSLMLESHNDVAVAIAEHVGGSVE